MTVPTNELEASAPPPVASVPTGRPQQKTVALLSLLIFAAKLGSSGLKLLTTLVLAKFLQPEDFGLIALAYVVVQLIEMLTEVGIQKTLVATKRCDSGMLDTAYTIQLTRGAFLTLLLLFACYPVSRIYSEPAIIPMLLVLSLQPVLAGIRSPLLYVAQRDVRLNVVIGLELGTQVVAMTVSIAIAAMFHSPLCAAIGVVAGEVVMAVGSHLLLKGDRPKPGWDPAAATEIFRMGRWAWPMAALFFAAISLDRLVGRLLLGDVEFGLYALSINLIQAVNNLIHNIIYRVYFPLLAKTARENPSRLADDLVQFRKMPQLICVTGGAALFFLGPQVASILFDSRFQGAGWMISILAIRLIVTPVINTSYRGLLAIGEAWHETITWALATIMLLITTPIMYHFFGQVGFVVAVGTNFLWCVPHLSYVLYQRGLYRVRSDLHALGCLVVGSLIGFLVSQLSSLAVNW